MGLRPTRVRPPAHGRESRDPGAVNTIAPGVLVHVVDQISGWRFLVDTGAAFSIIPHSSSLPASGRGIVGPTRIPIKCCGEREVQLKLSGRCFKWTFLQLKSRWPSWGLISSGLSSCLWIQPLASWSRMVLALPSPPSPFPVGQQLWPSCPQLILVLLARWSHLQRKCLHTIHF